MSASQHSACPVFKTCLSKLHNLTAAFYHNSCTAVDDATNRQLTLVVGREHKTEN